MSEVCNQCLLEIKQVYFTNAALKCAKGQGDLFSLMDKLLHKTSTPLPSPSDPALLANNFLDFFEGKISRIHHSCLTLVRALSPPLSLCHHLLLLTFKTITCSELEKIIKNSPIKSSSVDPLPVQLFGQVLIHML